MTLDIEQGVEYVTTEGIEITEDVVKEAWVVVIDLQSQKPLRIKMKNLLAGATDIDISFDGGSFI